jgi:hypothetical protein
VVVLAKYDADMVPCKMLGQLVYAAAETEIIGY